MCSHRSVSSASSLCAPASILRVNAFDEDGLRSLDPGFNIPKCKVREYCESIRESTKDKDGARIGWHTDREGLRLAGPRFALSIDPP